MIIAIAAAVLGAVVGAAVATVVARRRRDAPSTVVLEEPRVVVPPGVAQVIHVLRSAGIVLGPHDEVLQSSAQSRSLGLIRGSRLLNQDLLDLARQVRVDGEIRAVDLELHRESTSPVSLSSRVAPLDNGLVLVLSEDRTAARRVDETRRDFVANVGHELKTPIGAISLLAEALEEAADDPEAVRRFAGRMITESQRLSELVREIINLSRLQAADPLKSMEVVDVADILDDAVNRCRVLADRKNITIGMSVNDERVLGDPEQLTVAVTNLVENAISYSDEGTKVAISARRVTDDGEPAIDISVSDNGIGIAPSETERIFERFYRIDYARSRANGGTGLGLAIVKHIVAAHGGQVNVWSHLGHGSTFTIRLPEEITDGGARYDHVPDDEDRSEEEEST